MQNRDATEAALDRAVEYIHEHGWCRGTVQDSEGRVCLQGALMRAMLDDAGHWRRDGNGVFDNCWSAIAARLGHPAPSMWNDTECHDADEAIGVLKKAKEFL